MNTFIYEKKRFKDILLAPQTRAILSLYPDQQNSDDPALKRLRPALNRLLLQDAYRDLIERTINRPVWIAEARAPIWLPLQDLHDLAAPVIPWLAPGQTRPRLPVREALTDAVGGLVGEGGPDAQWIVPAMATAASIGDRAGIALARSIRLETEFPEFLAFDYQYARFGRPAQGGASSVRTERTPRPGPLPINIGNEARDRRPCASRLDYKRPVEVLRGPADTVAGEPNRAKRFGGWVVKFAAAVNWNGMISESFDGTVPVEVQLDIQAGSEAQENADARGLLLSLLMPRGPDQKCLLNVASLAVGETVIPFQRVRFRDEGPVPLKVYRPAETTKPAILRAAIQLVLDPRLDPRGDTPGLALSEIADALRAGLALPPVEIRFTVHPNSDRTEAVPDEQMLLSQPKASQPTIPEGDTRPPVTLRIPLTPVVRSRGALPLPPSSLLFIDFAYDGMLGSAPMSRQKRPRVRSKSLPANRGDLLATFYADRARVNRHGSIAFMIDLAFERSLDPAFVAKARPEKLDGDLIEPNKIADGFELTISVTNRDGISRNVFFGNPGTAKVDTNPPPVIKLAKVYELPLGMLLEKEGPVAQLAAGDMLELTLSEHTLHTAEPQTYPPKLDVGHRVKPTLWDSSSKSQVLLDGLDNSGGTNAGAEYNDLPFTIALRILLTDEPIIEPPPALYAALVRRATTAGRENSHYRLSLPLYAQSPLPWRVTVRDLKADFRAGFVRRAATFIWTLARPRDEIEKTGIHIVKADRNGQTFLPPKDIGAQKIGDVFIKARPIRKVRR